LLWLRYTFEDDGQASVIGHENEVDFICKSAAQELRKAKTEINTASGFVLDSMQIIVLMTFTLIGRIKR